MKRSLFYALIIGQIALLLLIAFQDQMIDRYGKEITLRTVDARFLEYGWIDYEGYLRANLAIEVTTKDKWEVDPETLDYNERVYVLLAEDENGYYDVEKVSTKKLKARDNRVVLSARYLYDMMPTSNQIRYEVDYAIEKMSKDLYGNINTSHPFSVTVKVAPWGQKKVVKVEKIKD